MAQIVPDQTLGAESSVINPNVDIEGIPSDQIEGGAIRGTNLFHSFEEFNVSEGQGAYFVNPAGIEHIFSRVTGNSVSQILGKLGVLGNADLFLINPNGIVFGSHATLDLKGSFLATTANSLIFEDGTQFIATDTSAPPLLTISIPAGLQFRETAGSILNQSQVLTPTLGLGLIVQPGKTLALVGGKITMQGGNITVPRGRIELGSVSGTGQVRLQEIDSGWALSYEDVQNFQDIELTQSPMPNDGPSLGLSLISTTNNIDGRGGGSIQVQGRRIILKNGSQFFGSGANIVVYASDTVQVSGSGSDFPSSIAGTAPLIGNPGSVVINTKKLIVQDRGRVNVRTTGFQTGDQLRNTTVSAGNLIVNASESIELDGNTETGLFSSTSSFGAAGNIIINTGKLIVRDGAIISTESTGVDALDQPIATGAAGNIDITANSLSLNQGTITAETSQSEGEGANIIFKISDLFKIENESLISATANGSADGGNIIINTPLLTVLPPTGDNGSDIIAKAERGNGGIIAISFQGISGIQERQATPGNQTNDLDASSELGTDGGILLNQILVDIPETVVIDPNALVANNPCKRGSESEFVITGRGGLPPSVNEDLSSEATQVGLVEPAPMESGGAIEQESREAEDKTISPPSVPTPIIPARGWVFNEKGEVVLVAYDPTVTGSQRLRKNGEGCTSP
ncbi:MAG: filamentous hemagglutinin N-terminal domain-containing protein [Xenococcaceae cyanobacterium MO_167.B27]|nr:filamentous hemagglutinin N-terminal domain-containing protein [Xenococcaceae cyanobacterium MO_167.B27]